MAAYCIKQTEKSNIGKVKKVALVGNPNVGKSVLFNALTGAYVTVSNYPGTSVEVSRGSATIEGQQWQVIDTPGMYSIHTITEEERVAREILLNESPDVVLHVLDARNLERMLAMTIQLIEAGLPVILIVNIMDEAERMGLTIDLKLLEQKLGIPVIGAATARKRGIDDICSAIALHRCSSEQKRFEYSRLLEQDINEVACLMLGEYVLSKRALALLLLQQDEEITELVSHRESDGYANLAGKVREIAFERRESFHLDLSLERNEMSRRIVKGVFTACHTWLCGR
jgi:ferrous iron transport protein B